VELQDVGQARHFGEDEHVAALVSQEPGKVGAELFQPVRQQLLAFPRSPWRAAVPPSTPEAALNPINLRPNHPSTHLQSQHRHSNSSNSPSCLMGVAASLLAASSSSVTVANQFASLGFVPMILQLDDLF
jgi:hypothetical protein